MPGIPRMNQLEGLRGLKGRRFSIWGRENGSPAAATSKVRATK